MKRIEYPGYCLMYLLVVQADNHVTQSYFQKKKQMKAKLKKMKEDPLYPLYLMLICKVCVLLPISIYACDVLIGVNVLESAEFGIDLVKQESNFFNGSDAPLLSVADHPYKHKFHNTVLFFVSFTLIF